MFSRDWPGWPGAGDGLRPIHHRRDGETAGEWGGCGGDWGHWGYGIGVAGRWGSLSGMRFERPEGE